MTKQEQIKTIVGELIASANPFVDVPIMSNEEIKRALGAEIRWCKKYEQQKEYADGVKVDILENSLNLIISQEQEIERLKEENELLYRITDEIYKEVEDNIRAEIANSGTSCHWCENIIRKKAVKEFAEKLESICLQRSEWDEDCEDMNPEYFNVGRLGIEDIEKLLEELE